MWRKVVQWLWQSRLRAGRKLSVLCTHLGMCGRKWVYCWFPCPCSVLSPSSLCSGSCHDMSAVSASAGRTGLRRGARLPVGSAVVFRSSRDCVLLRGFVWSSRWSCSSLAIWEPRGHSCVYLCSWAKCQILLSARAFQAGTEIGIFQKIVSSVLEIIVKGSRNPV